MLSSWAKRPWCVGVGVGAVPPRLSSLNMLRCLPLVGVCGRCAVCPRGQPPSCYGAGSWTSDATSEPCVRAGARECGALPVRRAPAQAGQAPCGRGGTGASETSLVGSTTRAVDPHGWFREGLRAGCLLAASDSARAVALIERLPSRRSAHPGRRSATPIERTRRRARRQRRQPTARQRQPGPQKA